MHCLVQPIDRIFVKGYIFLSFPKYMCKNIGESESKHLSDIYGQNPPIHAKQSSTDAL